MNNSKIDAKIKRAWYRVDLVEWLCLRAKHGRLPYPFKGDRLTPDKIRNTPLRELLLINTELIEVVAIFVKCHASEKRPVRNGDWVYGETHVKTPTNSYTIQNVVNVGDVPSMMTLVGGWCWCGEPNYLLDEVEWVPVTGNRSL